MARESEIICAMSATVVAAFEPMFTGKPSSASLSIASRLARPIRARIPQGDRRNSDLFSPHQDQPFLIDFGQGIDCLPAYGGLFRCRGTLRLATTDRTVDLPIAALELAEGAGRRKYQFVCLANYRTFAVDGLRPGDDDLLNRQIFFTNDLH